MLAEKIIASPARAAEAEAQRECVRVVVEEHRRGGGRYGMPEEGPARKVRASPLHVCPTSEHGPFCSSHEHGCRIDAQHLQHGDDGREGANSQRHNQDGYA